MSRLDLNRAKKFIEMIARMKTAQEQAAMTLRLPSDEWAYELSELIKLARKLLKEDA
jgi:hypothetical protein